MIELFLVAYLSKSPYVYRPHKTLEEACQDAKENGLEPVTVYRITLRSNGFPDAAEIACKWVEPKPAHWEVEPVKVKISVAPDRWENVP